MKTIKWNRLKEKVKDQLAQSRYLYDARPVNFLAVVPALASGKHPKKLLDVWYADAMKIVDKWDIRLAAKLIECFPGVVGKYSAITCDMDEQGEWVVALS